jgi:hypothetical protein
MTTTRVARVSPEQWRRRSSRCVGRADPAWSPGHGAGLPDRQVTRSIVPLPGPSAFRARYS